MGINSTEWVIQENNVCIVIGCSGQTYSLLLSSTQVDSIFSYLRHVTGGEDFQIRPEGMNKLILVLKLERTIRSIKKKPLKDAYIAQDGPLDTGSYPSAVDD